MKRAFAILLTLMLAASAFAQADAVALAAQREQEENVKRLTATIQEVQEAQGKQQERISGLASEVDKLRTEVAKANNNAANHEALKRLNDQILEVDKSRVADNKKIYEALEQLKKLILDRPAPPPVRNALTAPPVNPGNSATGAATASRPTGNATEEGFEYVVQSGDRLDLIVKAYRAQNIMITERQVMNANPNVKWERMRIGQKIFIPKP
ncbi:MAG TPA: LysM domain-containing protein, partial [Candidatus Acidoferrum sp.]|nr:LysM domain-containing protein [Candidatus Acidoferrum sp.]